MRWLGALSSSGHENIDRCLDSWGYLDVTLPTFLWSRNVLVFVLHDLRKTDED